MRALEGHVEESDAHEQTLVFAWLPAIEVVSTIILRPLNSTAQG